MNLEDPALAGLQPIDNETLGKRVYNELRNFLMVGGVQPGEKLTLRQLTTAFGTSLMPVREAVHRLAAEGALEVLPNRAIRVPKMSRARFDELVKLRVMLEGLAVATASTRMKPHDIEHLEETNEGFIAEMRKPPESQQPFLLNKEFHFTIYRAAEMPVLLGMIENMWLQFGPFLHFSMGVKGRMATNKFAPESHRRMIQSMKRRDGEIGRKALEDDILGAVELILQFGDIPA
ncbi:MAG: GntR family transcriptional regulator [Xanthobacteraceae bacterium]|nr:GntR family transcriptional regulator [Xanthobacteraceae bacterium]QYK46217.1 MAG: GntR family transcriptional regulator [Xanthobacteraceae bacterium]HMN52511.1 GntR family transcriptional regulator [Xanthobacteraceae bacterium]